MSGVAVAGSIASMSAMMLYSGGMATWGFLIWSEFSSTKVDKDSILCQGNTILNLLLSFNIILVVQCALVVLALLSSALFSYKKDSKAVVIMSYFFSRLSTCFVVLCYKAMLGLNIAIAVLMYSKSCNMSAPKMLAKLEPFMITQFVLLPISLCCIVCCVTCNGIINALKENEYYKPRKSREDEMIETKLLEYSDGQ